MRTAKRTFNECVTQKKCSIRILVNSFCMKQKEMNELEKTLSDLLSIPSISPVEYVQLARTLVEIGNCKKELYCLQCELYAQLMDIEILWKSMLWMYDDSKN